MNTVKDLMTILLESVRLEKNSCHLVFTCYMPNAGLTEKFDYCGTEITGCVYQGHVLYKQLLESLKQDYGFPRFEKSKVKKVLKDKPIYQFEH